MALIKDVKQITAQLSALDSKSMQLYLPKELGGTNTNSFDLTLYGSLIWNIIRQTCNQCLIVQVKEWNQNQQNKILIIAEHINHQRDLIRLLPKEPSNEANPILWMTLETLKNEDISKLAITHMIRSIYSFDLKQLPNSWFPPCSLSVQRYLVVDSFGCLMQLHKAFCQ
jgi:hypothetical protein